ncbi:ABC transporter substrate-binding protein [Paracraurococcus lichenis]|uniref:ABC transporter substrate-binding protein n=1 Tax=Paracraurococcus lichenis TaxID=3064888 RepID=A0ABT9DXE3_9PROT|nr:ABC transporter substrate-binding protein [Paracraurococcus sp. LOR1-02]MDO9708567.1 ABC transporter substrate-binding protein [Paracraurococcus sp. LOR1-02]
MSRTERRTIVGALAALPLAAPATLRAQPRPVQIGLLSDMSGPFRDVGGPGNRIAAELAVQDFGGSVLGRPVTVRQADGQNRADVSAALAREWIDNLGVDVLADGAASSSGLAIQEVCREKKRIYIITGPATSDMTGAKCSPYGMHFGFDTYALAHGTGTALTKAGGNSWYFITSDYAFGHALERDTMAAVRANGGQVLGAVRAPLNNADFSSFLIQARASGAKVIGFALAGLDLQNCIKQAAEFGLTRGGARIATLLVQITDIVALGQRTCEGMVLTDSFYWDLNDATRAWAQRYVARMKSPPGLQHAAVYTGVTHWLKSVREVGSTEAEAVAARMKATPVNDMYNTDVRIREDGRTLHTMYLWEIKKQAEAKQPFDFCSLLATIPPEQAWRPLSEGGCPLVRS